MNRFVRVLPFAVVALLLMPESISGTLLNEVSGGLPTCDSQGLHLPRCTSVQGTGTPCPAEEKYANCRPASPFPADTKWVCVRDSGGESCADANCNPETDDSAATTCKKPPESI